MKEPPEEQPPARPDENDAYAALRAAIMRRVAEELDALPQVENRTLGPGILFVAHRLRGMNPFAVTGGSKAACGLAGCEHPAVARVRLTYPRGLPPEGVSGKEQVLCGPCCAAKVTAFEGTGGEVRLVGWIGPSPAD